MGGIYQIKCAVTDKAYVGSAINPRRRRRQHWCDLRKGAHRNPKLQAAWNKYGEKSFMFEVIEHVPRDEDLISREQHHLDQLFESGLQLNIQPNAHSSLGTKHSLETRRRMSEASRDPERLARFSKMRKGHEVSEETRRKISEGNRGRKHSQDEIDRRVRSRQGYRHSDDTKMKMSISQKKRTRASSRLSEEDVAEIRERCEQGESQTSVAADFSISPSYVSRLVSRSRWT